MVNSGTDRMRELVLSLPDQIVSGAKAARTPRIGPAGGFDMVAIAGMGGSGISARIAQGLLWDRTPLPMYACNDYDVPAAVTEQALFIAVSYSGDTEETLSGFRQARRRGCRIIAITQGGELGWLAARSGYPVLPVPGGMPPRAALGFLFSSLLVTLERLGVCGSQRRGLEEAVRLMRRRRNRLLVRACTIAKHLSGRLPIVYSTSRVLDAVADRWRCQLNENAGVLCHSNVLPEHNHNEIVGMGRPVRMGRESVVIALLDKETHERTRFRLESALDIAAKGYHSAIRLETEGGSRLARVFSLTMLGDLVSVELARLAGKDAMEIERIVELKRRMQHRK